MTRAMASNWMDTDKGIFNSVRQSQSSCRRRTPPSATPKRLRLDESQPPLHGSPASDAVRRSSLDVGGPACDGDAACRRAGLAPPASWTSETPSQRRAKEIVPEYSTTLDDSFQTRTNFHLTTPSVLVVGYCAACMRRKFRRSRRTDHELVMPHHQSPRATLCLASDGSAVQGRSLPSSPSLIQSAPPSAPQSHA